MIKRFLFVSMLLFLGSAKATQACSFNPHNKCEVFAYSKYFPEVGSEHAYNLASSACSIVSDVSVLEFLWSKHAKLNSPAHAMDLAIEEAPGTLDGKLEMLLYAWSYYYFFDLNYSVAATKAAAGAARIKDLDCLVAEIRRYETKTIASLDAAFDTCAAQGR